MRVLLVSPYTPPLVGGLERVAASLARGLNAAGHDVRIASQFSAARHTLRRRFCASEAERTFSLDGVQVSILRPRWPLAIPGTAIYAMMWMPRLHRLTRALLLRGFAGRLRELAKGADVVHYLGTGTDTMGFAAAAAARGVGSRFVVQPAIHPGRWGDRPLDAALYRQADAVMAFTACEADEIARMGVECPRVHVVPGSVDPPPPTDPSGFRHRHGIAGPCVVFLGRKTPDKGIDRLLAAWPRVRAAIPAASLVLVGPSADTRLAMADLGIAELSDASEQEKHDALSACDLLCMPSLGESFGIAMLEAWLHGKPVIVSDLPALRESVDAARAGVLVRPEPAAIAEALVALLNDPSQRAVMGKRGREFALTYTHQRMLDATLHAYADAMRR